MTAWDGFGRNMDGITAWFTTACSVPQGQGLYTFSASEFPNNSAIKIAEYQRGRILGHAIPFLGKKSSG